MKCRRDGELPDGRKSHKALRCADCIPLYRSDTSREMLRRYAPLCSHGRFLSFARHAVTLKYIFSCGYETERRKNENKSQK